MDITTSKPFRLVSERSKCHLIKTSLKWLTVAMPLQATTERLERDQRETRERDQRETIDRLERSLLFQWHTA